MSSLDTVAQAGYFDQPHLTRALKRYIGLTPAQVADEGRSERLSRLGMSGSNASSRTGSWPTP